MREEKTWRENMWKLFAIHELSYHRIQSWSSKDTIKYTQFHRRISRAISIQWKWADKCPIVFDSLYSGPVFSQIVF